MQIVYCLFLIIYLFSEQSVANTIRSNRTQPFKSSISPIPRSIQKQIKVYTWHQGCPVPLKKLRYLTLSYWGFDKKPHQGSLIVNQVLATEVIQIFKLLYLHRFPLERMELMDAFKGNDQAAMTANNTSAFNCRDLSNKPGIFSQHSYGRALDINPRINPYVAGQLVLPPEASPFSDRSKPYRGKISLNTLIYRLFIQYGWDWGGNWYDVQDYQHFEKRAKGEKRNPYGNL